LATELKMSIDTLRDIFKEKPGVDPGREVLDRIYRTARKLGYNFRKLKIGKRMQYRKELLDEVLEKVSSQASSGREEILKYLQQSRALVDRVHKRVFGDEFGAE